MSLRILQTIWLPLVLTMIVIPFGSRADEAEMGRAYKTRSSLLGQEFEIRKSNRNLTESQSQAISRNYSGKGNDMVRRAFHKDREEKLEKLKQKHEASVKRLEGRLKAKLANKKGSPAAGKVSGTESMPTRGVSNYSAPRKKVIVEGGNVPLNLEFSGKKNKAAE